jgi:predicted RNA-binding protein Jag
MGWYGKEKEIVGFVFNFIFMMVNVGGIFLVILYGVNGVIIGGGKFYVVDINNHHKKRVESVKTIAYMMAERARYFKSSIELDPMPAFDRRIVHEYLSNAPDLKTESLGDGANRRVVIRYVSKEI